MARRSAIGALACAAVALVIAATAFAAVPRDGSFRDEGNKPRSRDTQVVFEIDGDKLKDFTATSRSCGAAVRRAIGVSDSGEFGYRGKARDLSTGSAGPGSGPIGRDGKDTQVKISGRFVSGSKAKGTFRQDGCSTVRFVAKRRNIKHRPGTQNGPTHTG